MPKHEPEVLRARKMRGEADPHDDARIVAMKIITDEEFERVLREFDRLWSRGKDMI